MAPIRGELTKHRAEQRRKRAQQTLALYKAVMTPEDAPSATFDMLTADQLAMVPVSDEAVAKMKEVFIKERMKWALTEEILHTEVPEVVNEAILRVLNKALRGQVIDLDAVYDARKVNGFMGEKSDIFVDRGDPEGGQMEYLETIHASFDIGFGIGEPSFNQHIAYTYLKFDGVLGIERYTEDGKEKINYRHVRANASEEFIKAGKSTMEGIQALFARLLRAIGVPSEAADAFVITWDHRI